jgi:hypothetical protein
MGKTAARKLTESFKNTEDSAESVYPVADILIK